jgi:uncharacterized protein (DUF736 family)
MPNSTTISTANYRVEIHPGFDLWMRGARFGVVVREYKSSKTGKNMVAVKMDHPQVRQLFRCSADDVTVL